MYGVVVGQHYSETLALLHVEKLNKQLPGKNVMQLYFAAQKNKCF